MESLLGFGEEHTDNQDCSSSSSSNGYKLVPWLNWDEWDFVRDSLFSSSPDSVSTALRRISAWRTRGCLPVVVEVTAAIIEIQQKDPHFRDDQPSDALHSEELLRMLYSMAIIRLVNCVVEKTRKQTGVSIAQAADEIGIPRKLVDIRHEGSHRDLPSLPVVRPASIEAIDWLKFHYWEPQKKAIPFQRHRTANIRNEIKSKLCELAFCLNVKQSPKLGSSLVKGKRGKHCEQLCVRNKFFSLMASKLHLSKSEGSKKQITKTLKILIRLYSSFSSEVVSVLLEFLLKASRSSDLAELPKDSPVGPNIHTSLDDWKHVISKFSNKEPELLLSLLNAVLDMIETQEAMKYETGRQNLTSSECRPEIHQFEQLSSLCAWLVGNLKGLKALRHKDVASEINVSSADINIPKAILIDLLRKCLLVLAPGNNQLMVSALHIAQLTGNESLLEKLNKLSFLGSSSLDATEENSSLVTSKNLLTQQEEYISQAVKKVELVNLHRMKSKVVNTIDGDLVDSVRWIVAKSWNPCPIGMLPRALSSSGRLPVLDCEDNHKKVTQSSERKEHWQLNRCSGKRAASCDIQQLDNSNVKKIRETVKGYESDIEDFLSLEGVKGCLMMDGVWKKVGEEDVHVIESTVRILV